MADDTPDQPDDDEQPRADTPAPDTPDAADPSTLKRARRRKAKAEDESAAFWSRVLADPVGRREVWLLLEAARWRDTPFAVGPTGYPQPEATWFQAGQREYGLRLYHKLIHLCRDGVALMLDEHDPRFARPAGAPPR